MPGVEELAIGRGGEWFVRFLDGSSQSRDLTMPVSDCLPPLLSKGCDVVSVQFGDGGRWVVRYTGDGHSGDIVPWEAGDGHSGDILPSYDDVDDEYAYDDDDDEYA